MKNALRLFFLVTLATPCIAGSIVYMRVPRPSIEEHLKLAQDVEAERVRTLRNLFQKAGCPQVVEQTVPEEKSPNLICILPGIEEGTILVGASLDYAAEDSKAPTHWSALALLPLLAKSLAAVPHRSTLALAAFSGHDRGMRGATWYLRQLPDVQRRTTKAIVDLDSLGRTPTVYALAHSDKALATWLQAAAQSLKLATPLLVDASTPGLPPQNGQVTPKVEDLWANAKALAQEDIPAITIQSTPPALLPALRQDGSIPDLVTKTGFDMDAYDDTYRLLCVYVLYLDGNLGRPPVQLGTYSGTLVDTAGFFGAHTIGVSLSIDHFSTIGELDRYEQILLKGGEDALADALEKANDKSTYRFGLRLAIGVKMAILQYSGTTPYVYLVAPRLRRRASTTSDDYRFDVIKLNLDGKGQGDGLYYDSATLRFSSRHDLEIGDHRYRPDEIRRLRLEPLTSPKTTLTTVRR
jgi:hypothetical protein